MRHHLPSQRLGIGRLLALAILDVVGFVLTCLAAIAVTLNALPAFDVGAWVVVQGVVAGFAALFR